MNSSSREPMIEMFLIETTQHAEQLEMLLIDCEKSGSFTTSIDELFRIMHTIKGNASILLFDNIATLAHSLEDLLCFLREKKDSLTNQFDLSRLIDLVFNGIDFIKNEIVKIEKDQAADGEPTSIIHNFKEYLTSLKKLYPEMGDCQCAESPKEALLQNYYISPSPGDDFVPDEVLSFEIKVFFHEGCLMEDIRAFTVVNKLKEISSIRHFEPSDIVESEQSISQIQNDGFKIMVSSEKSITDIEDLISKIPFVQEVYVKIIAESCLEAFPEEPDHDFLTNQPLFKEEKCALTNFNEGEKELSSVNVKQSVINVNLVKLDQLMDLVGELVIAESLVTQNPELAGLPLNDFYKAARQLRKISSDIQDLVMAIRMVPLSVIFQKMNRLVRDMSKKINKEVSLEIIGEETEVDKNIIDHLSDPLMHLLRNSLDHGIESAAERAQKGKPVQGKIILEAKNASGDVLIIIKDDGRGLDKESILARAQANQLLTKPPEELTDREIFSFILLPGFSTRDQISEYSGRGVGMDVVSRNIETIGGTLQIDSQAGAGTTICLKIPLTLAIIEGMNIKVGNARYTLPITAIKESFRIKSDQVFFDPNGNEMLFIRKQCYPVLRLHQLFNVETAITDFAEGIILMLEDNENLFCLLADNILGEQQVVVKALPSYLKKVAGVAGCTLLGDGSISLIMDITGLARMV